MAALPARRMSLLKVWGLLLMSTRGAGEPQRRPAVGRCTACAAGRGRASGAARQCESLLPAFEALGPPTRQKAGRASTALATMVPMRGTFDWSTAAEIMSTASYMAPKFPTARPGDLALRAVSQCAREAGLASPHPLVVCWVPSKSLCFIRPFAGSKCWLLHGWNERSAKHQVNG
jgi:hypothetical protein